MTQEFVKKNCVDGIICWLGHPVLRWLSEVFCQISCFLDPVLYRDIPVKRRKAAPFHWASSRMMVVTSSIQCANFHYCSFSCSQGTPPIAKVSGRMGDLIQHPGIWQGTEDRRDLPSSRWNMTDGSGLALSCTKEASIEALSLRVVAFVTWVVMSD